MAGIDVYHKLPIWGQNLLVSAYGFRLRRLRYGPTQRGHLARLLETDSWSREALVDAQKSKLQQTLAEAVAHVPHYRAMGLPAPDDPEQANAALADWPILTKKAIADAGGGLIRDGIEQATLTKISTGGTTGTPLQIYVEKDALQQNYAFFERHKRWAGVGPSDRVATFAGRPVVPQSQTRPPYWRLNRPGRQLLCSSYHIGRDSADAYLDALEAFAPAMIDSYPSSIEPLARRALETGRKGIRPRAVLTSSESLFDEVRAVITEAFGCPVFDEYGAAEMVAQVSQCEMGGYHVSTDFGVLEILDDDGARVPEGVVGRIVATGFLNRAMPLIRYDTGDLAAWSSKVCTCGRHAPLLEGLQGRMDDVILTPEGRRVGRIDPIFKAVKSLRETRVVQEEIDRLVVEYVADAPLPDNELAELTKELRLRLGPTIRLEFAQVDALPRTRSGKLRTVVSRLESP